MRCFLSFPVSDRKGQKGKDNDKKCCLSQSLLLLPVPFLFLLLPLPGKTSRILKSLGGASQTGLSSRHQIDPWPA